MSLGSSTGVITGRVFGETSLVAGSLVASSLLFVDGEGLA
jgi:hypothetical protein